jgi:glutathione S-transferase
MLTLYEHPLSPYAQKCKIAMYEKGVTFEAKMPDAIGTGDTAAFLKVNPRGEVPALLDGGFAVFDSTVILEYIEDKWPSPPMLPPSPAERARARMIEDVMDTAYEPINWGLGEIRWFKRAEGSLAETITGRAQEQLTGLYAWLTRELGEKEWLNGASFGWADLSVIPYINGSAGQGLGPDPASPLGQWQARCNARESVTKCNEAIRKIIAQMAQVAKAVEARVFKREYRDHRLEWMIRSGGLEVVLKGIETGTIRFSNEVR